jgi:hypothetical protein
MTHLEKLVLRTRMEAQWEMAVRQQRLLERIQDPSGVECPCGSHIQEELYLSR